MRLVLAAVVGILCAALMLPAAMPVPRPAPDFTIHFKDGTELPLKSFRGKVIALSFVHTTCPHCQHASQVFTKLFDEYGARGFQPLGVAFNPMANLYVDDFVHTYGIKYPVGFSTDMPVLDFLGFSAMERYVVPQIVWIDRKGIIRSETPPMGEEKLLQEPYWREMIETLLKEPAEGAKKPTATHAVHAKRSQ